MNLKHCYLTEKQRDKLLEFLVGEMTVRTVTDPVGVNRTTAGHFFHCRRVLRLKENPGH
jgi:transposase-like protein